MTIKLLRYLNSAIFGLRNKIQSISHALNLLGERELRKWIAVVAVGMLAKGKPDELMKVPLVRERFCELLTPHVGFVDQANELFLLGLLFVSDAILDQPLNVILEDLPVRNEIKEALLQQPVPYRNILELALAMEYGDWAKIRYPASILKVREEQIPELYLSAVEWSTALGNQIMQPVAQ